MRVLLTIAQPYALICGRASVLSIIMASVRGQTPHVSQIYIPPPPQSNSPNPLPVLAKLLFATTILFPLAGIPALVWLGKRYMFLASSTHQIRRSVVLVERELVAFRQQQKQLHASLDSMGVRLEEMNTQIQLQSDRHDKSNVTLQKLLAEAKHLR